MSDPLFVGSWEAQGVKHAATLFMLETQLHIFMYTMHRAFLLLDVYMQCFSGSIWGPSGSRIDLVDLISTQMCPWRVSGLTRSHLVFLTLIVFPQFDGLDLFSVNWCFFFYPRVTAMYGRARACQFNWRWIQGGPRSCLCHLQHCAMTPWPSPPSSAIIHSWCFQEPLFAHCFFFV